MSSNTGNEIVDFSEIHHSCVSRYIEEYLLKEGVDSLDISGIQFDYCEKLPGFRHHGMYKIYVSWENREDKLRKADFILTGRFYQDGVVNDVQILEF